MENGIKKNVSDGITAMPNSKLKLNQADFYLRKAEDFFQRLDMDKAIKYAKLQLELFPDSYEAYQILMDANFEAGNFEKALVYCDKLLLTQDNDPLLYSRKAYILYLRQDMDQAVEFYDKAIELDPNYYDAICDKAKLLTECIDCNEDALITYKQAILVNPNLAEAYMGLASIYLEMGDKKKAVEFSSKAHELEPEDDFYTIHSNIMKQL